jgi:hypothetical protein
VGQYLTTFKQSEFRSASLIKERTEKDYLPILRTTLTSISKVNKTDVETLRTSFGVLSSSISLFFEFTQDHDLFARASPIFREQPATN